MDAVMADANKGWESSASQTNPEAFSHDWLSRIKMEDLHTTYLRAYGELSARLWISIEEQRLRSTWRMNPTLHTPSPGW